MIRISSHARPNRPPQRMLLIVVCWLPFVVSLGFAQDNHDSGSPHRDVTAPSDWPEYGRAADEQHYSQLQSINDGNVGQLGLVWWQDLPIGATVTQPIE